MKSLLIKNTNKFALVGHGYCLYNFFLKFKESSLQTPIIITHKVSKEEEKRKYDKTIYKNIYELNNQTKIYSIKNFDKKSFLKILKKEKINYIISCSSKFIFDDKIIKKYKNKIFNLHASELPKYRGGAVFSWKILNNEFTSCATMHKIIKKIDAGDIVLQTKIKKLSKKSEVIDLIKDSNLKFDELIQKFIYNVKSGKTFQLKKQNEKKSIYFPRINSKIDGKINWNWNGKDIVLFIKAMSKPFDGAFSFLISKKKIKIKIFKCIFFKSKKNHKYLVGRIFFDNRKYLKIITLDGFIKVFRKDIIFENGYLKNLSGKRFLIEENKKFKI